MRALWSHYFWDVWFPPDLIYFFHFWGENFDWFMQFFWKRFYLWNLKLEIWSLKFGIWNLRFWKLKLWNFNLVTYKIFFNTTNYIWSWFEILLQQEAHNKKQKRKVMDLKSSQYIRITIWYRSLIEDHKTCQFLFFFFFLKKKKKKKKI